MKYIVLNMIFMKKMATFIGRIKICLKKLKKVLKWPLKKYPKLKSIGIDTWGVDYTYIDRFGHIIRDPISYRDDRGKSVRKHINQMISDADLYHQTGIQYMHFNTIYQMYHDTLYF